MSYPPYYLPYPPNPIYSPPLYYQNLVDPNPRDIVTPSSFIKIVVLKIQSPKTNLIVGSKVKMIDYLKFDPPKYKEDNDPFEYIKAVKMTADKLVASDSRAIQMARFILKCKKVKN